MAGGSGGRSAGGKVLEQESYAFACALRSERCCCVHLGCRELDADVAGNGPGVEKAHRQPRLCELVFLFLPGEKKKILISISLN